MGLRSSKPDHLASRVREAFVLLRATGESTFEPDDVLELCAEVERLQEELRRAVELNERSTRIHQLALAEARDQARSYLAEASEEKVRAAKAEDEVERLKETIAEWQTIHGTFAASGAPDDVHFACRAEVERLKAERDDAIDAEKIALRAIGEENERLRAAVEEIKDAYRKIGEAPNSDIRALARAHLFTVLNQVCET
jgi:hypothetical protein